MEIKVSTENGSRPVTIIHVDGNIDSATAEKFQSKVEELIKSGVRDILIDLTNVRFVSSSGIRVINAIFNQLRGLSPDLNDDEMRKGINSGVYKSPHLKLLNPSKDALNTIKMTGLDMYIDIFTDQTKAVSSF